MKTISETNTLFKRNLKLSLRSLETVMSGLLTPVLLMLLFVYVLGGAMDVGELSYVDFVLPGVLVQCIAQSSSVVGIVVNQDVHSGMVERLLTLNLSKSAFLNGHVFAAAFRSVMSSFVVLLVAWLIGFRPNADLAEWLVAWLLIFCFILAFTWISVLFGLLAKSAEMASLFTVLTTVLPYLSAGFAPTDNMPTAIRLFAEYQPMSPIIQALRGLLLGLPNPPLVQAFLWSISLIFIFRFLAIVAFNQRVRKK
ncbi:ABC transporter permease [Enterococcus sp. DIV1298c]|uniref:ABC transporter permease n=1 Tax=Enterococcus sp. DIV1298c TaxID=2815328 RepID=UPI001A9196FC|nr:ABC transporter permease [Enterococcus sp. DIV1298c]MBO0461399.1 ABC transporter permease [Enterococcus sp. DIV1298c]